MGAQCSSMYEARRHDRKISSMLDKDNLANMQTVKLLLLGAGDSGKTTMRNQFKVVYGDGFSKSKRRQFAPIILGNIADCMTTLLAQCDPKDFNDRDRANAKLVSQSQNYAQGFFFKESVAAVKELWHHASIQAAYKRRGATFSFQDCFDHYLESLLRLYPAWGGEGWLPQQQDCVRARVRTSGIIEDELRIKGVRFRIFDVGGQRNERRKWFHCFDNVTAVIFVAALSGYNEVLYEDSSKNRLEEAFDLFDEVTSVDFFKDTPFLLFLNKRDLFEKKYKKEKIDLDVSGRFPRAPSRKEAPRPSQAIEWVASEFRARFRKKREDALYEMQHGGPSARNSSAGVDSAAALAHPGSSTASRRANLPTETASNTASAAESTHSVVSEADIASGSLKNVYVHLTNATDPKNVNLVFEDAREIVLTKNLDTSGLI